MYYLPVAHPLDPNAQRLGPVAPQPSLQDMLGFDPLQSYAVPPATGLIAPGAGATVTAPAGLTAPATVAPNSPEATGIAQQIVDFITHPLTQGALGALSGVLMTPKWTGPGYGLATALQMGSQGVIRGQARRDELARQSTRDQAYTEFMMAQAEKMRQPAPPESAFNKPSHPSSWATPQSVSAWERTITPDRPYGDWSVLQKAPRQLNPLEQQKLELEIQRIRKAIQTTTNDAASWGEIGVALNALQSIRKGTYWEDLDQETRSAIDAAIQIAADKLRNKTGVSKKPFDPTNVDSVFSELP